MNRTDFLETLRRALSGEVDYTIVNENIEYYAGYIDMEMRKGKTEEETLTLLGDPRLLAKTIIETNKSSDGQKVYANEPSGGYRDSYSGYNNNGTGEGSNRNSRRSIWRIPSWIFIIITILFVVLVLTIFTSLLHFLWPLILIIVIVRGIAAFWKHR